MTEPQDNRDLWLALEASDRLSPGWRDRLGPDPLDGEDRTANLLTGVALYRTMVEATVAGDYEQAALFEGLADAEVDRAMAAQPADSSPKPLTRADTPALNAWEARGDEAPWDALWRAACFERQALELAADGALGAALAALAKARAFVPKPPERPARVPADAGQTSGCAPSAKRGSGATGWARAVRGVWR